MEDILRVQFVPAGVDYNHLHNSLTFLLKAIRKKYYEAMLEFGKDIIENP